MNKDGDVIWSTTQESMSQVSRRSADVAENIARQLGADYERVRRGKLGFVGTDALGLP